MQDNPLFAEQIRNTMEQMRERNMLPGQVVEPMLHTWAAQVAWERLKYEQLRRTVWGWIAATRDGIPVDLEAELRHLGCTRPGEED